MKKKLALCFIMALMGILVMSVALAEGVCAHSNTRVEADASSHRIVCSDCGAVLWSEGHYANCTARGVCGYCGTAYAGDEVVHGASRYDTTAVAHWVICAACGETVYEEEHYSWCDAIGACAVCGAGYAGDNVRHKDANMSMAFDEFDHWYVCVVCGGTTAPVGHYASAQNPNVCGACGTAMPGQGTLKQGADGRFYYYGANGEIDRSFSHPAFSFQGGKFMIVKGVLDTTANGVVYMSGADFYFYAGGQVQEVSRLAEYTGSWFLLSKGKVNQGYTGLYEYDNELFLITEGRLRSDFTGIWDDSKLGEVEIVKGQVAGVG